ncbi:hypothetical protein FACS1894105_14230 [Clostridia bacterium]|nr:hypothetical protein FACS1894105_14230 [Clostridia bacterium]
MFLYRHKTFHTSEENLFEVYSPDIRDKSYIAALDYQFELLEKAIGVNKGVLSNLDTVNATATAIKRSTLDTFALVGDIRRSVEIAVNAYTQAADVLANAASLSAPGEWTVKYSWGFALLEDSAETWKQYLEAQGAGVLSPAELRAWLLDVSIDEAEKGMPGVEQLTASRGVTVNS